jgi:hypothetical protein
LSDNHLEPEVTVEALTLAAAFELTRSRRRAGPNADVHRSWFAAKVVARR